MRHVPIMASARFWGIIVMSVLQSSLLARSAEAPAPAPVAHGEETASPAAAPPAGAAAIKSFPILEYRVEGNTLMRAIDIERAVTPYLGEGRSIKDVEAARQSLEKAYHERGFQTVLVNIPQQEVSSGVVRLSVIEAPVGQVQIKGS